MEVDSSSKDQAYPGKLLVPNTTSIIAGDGTYVYLGKIYANVRGTITIIPKKSWNNQDDLDKICVKQPETDTQTLQAIEEENLS